MSANLDILPVAGRSPTGLLARGMAAIGDNMAMSLGILLAVFVLLFSFAGGLLYHVDPYAIHGNAIFQAPSAARLLGTDQIGRDEMARLIAGGKSTLIVSLPAALLTIIVGAVYGMAAALGPGWFDKALMRVLDAILALPGIVILIFFAALIPLNNFSLILLLGLTSWPGLARIIRNEAIAQRNRDFVMATRQMGASTWYIARVHLLRVMAPILVVNGTLLVGDSILALSGLSFLGLGVQPPYPSWGGLLQSGLDLIELNPYWLIIPAGFLVFASMLSASLIGNALVAGWGGRR